MCVCVCKLFSIQVTNTTDAVCILISIILGSQIPLLLTSIKSNQANNKEETKAISATLSAIQADIRSLKEQGRGLGKAFTAVNPSADSANDINFVSKGAEVIIEILIHLFICTCIHVYSLE